MNAPAVTRRAIASPVGSGVLLWTARRVEVDRYSRCAACGSPTRVVSERAVVAGQSLPQWVVVAEGCSAAGCDAA